MKIQLWIELRRTLRFAKYILKVARVHGTFDFVVLLWCRYFIRIPSYIITKKPSVYKKGKRTLNRTRCSVEASQVLKDPKGTRVWGKNMLGRNLKTEFEIPSVQKKDRTQNWEAGRSVCVFVLLTCIFLQGFLGWLAWYSFILVWLFISSSVAVRRRSRLHVMVFMALSSRSCMVGVLGYGVLLFRLVCRPRLGFVLWVLDQLVLLFRYLSHRRVQLLALGLDMLWYNFTGFSRSCSAPSLSVSWCMQYERPGKIFVAWKAIMCSRHHMEHHTPRL